MNDFLAMGGYAQYVWPSYGLACMVLIWNIWSALRTHREAKARAERALAMAAADTAARKI